MMGMNRKPFAPAAVRGSTHKSYPALLAATEVARASNIGVIFYERGFFGVVWFEGECRRVREMKRWTIDGSDSFKPKRV